MRSARTLALVALCLAGMGILVVRTLDGPDDPESATAARDAEEARAEASAADVPAPGLAPGSWRVRVTVLEGEERAPVAFADVRVVLYHRDVPGDHVERTVRTDGEGRVEIDLADSGLGPDDLLVHVDTRGNPFDPSAYPAKPADDAERRLDATVVLRPGVTARGVVNPPPGFPLSAVRLWENDVVACPVRLAPDGSFAFEGLPRDAQVSLRAAALYQGRRLTGNGRLVAGRDDFRLTWSAVRPGDRVMFAVRMRDVHGKDVAASVRWGVGSGRDVTWRREREGKGEVQLDFAYQPAARLVLVGLPSDDAGLGHVLRAGVPAAEPGVDLRFPAARSLDGRLTWRGSGPRPSLEVSLLLLLEEPVPSPVTLLSLETVPDGTGGFGFDGLGPYRYWLRVTDGAGHVLAERDVAPELGEVEIDVSPAVRVRVTVQDDTGAAVPEATVTVSAAPPGVPLDPRAHPLDPRVFRFRSVSSAATDASGRAVLDGLRSKERYRLVVEGPDEGPDLLEHEWQGWPAEPTVVTLRPAYAISGRVLDGEGAPVPGVTVVALGIDMPNEGARVVRRGGGGVSIAQPQARTDREGAFRIHPLGGGTWRLSVHPSEGPAIEAAAGARGVVLMAPPDAGAEWIRLRIHVPDLRPADRGAMAFYGCRHARLDERGVAAFSHVRAGSSERVWIAGLSDGRYVWEEAVEATEDVVTLRALRGGTLRGRVRVEDGVVLDGLSLVAFGMAPPLFLDEEPTAGFLPWSADAEQGTFEVHGLPPGTWSVTLWGDAGERRLTGEVEGGPGDDVVVDLR